MMEKMREDILLIVKWDSSFDCAFVARLFYFFI